MSAIVYARVPDSLKKALHDHAASRGLTLTGAVVEVAERGLEAISTGRAVASLEDKLELASRELERTRARLKEAQIRLRAARERDEAINRAYGAVAERMQQKLAQCPVCREPVSGSDLLTRGCPHCGKALTSLLAPTRAGLDRDECLALLGALGILAGLAAGGLANPPDDVEG